ncbi:MAG TPA: hypothetical protein VM223_19360 [Planctomycetota bacterium]|nr:hypothetical protein [Planctomycetota bacterium]
MLVTACCPSTRAVQKMRGSLVLVKEEDATLTAEAAENAKAKREDRARKNLLKLVKHFGKPKGDPCWRAETITTMLALEGQLQVAEREPDLHTTIKSLLLSEARLPKLKQHPPDDRIAAGNQLRAWSIYSLGSLADRDLDAFFVAMLADDVDSGHANCELDCAAFNSLSRRMATIAANRDLRNKLLAVLPRLQIQLDSNADHLSQSDVDQLRHYIRFYENSLKTYEAVVDLLPAAGSSSISEKELVVYLRWDYQNLASGKHRSANKQEVFNRNVSKLLSLAWHSSKDVRKLSRIILSEFAPLPLFEELSKHIGAGGPLLNEDGELLANLLPIADEAGKQDEGYLVMREQAFDLLSEKRAAVRVESREVVFARLLAHDPQLLADHLLAANARALDEQETQILQHLRFLDRLRRLKLSEGTSDRLTAAIAAFARTRIASVRQQVVSGLLPDQPRFLSAGIAAALPEMLTEAVDHAQFLAAAYVAALEALEQSSQGGISAADADQFFPLFSHILDRPEFDIKEKAISFLMPRDPNRLIMILSEQVRREAGIVGQEGYTLLGDLTEELSKLLSQETLSAAADAIAQGLVSGDEEQVLLCCRYLLQLHAPVPLDCAGNLPESARIMLRSSGTYAGIITIE